MYPPTHPSIHPRNYPYIHPIDWINGIFHLGLRLLLFEIKWLHDSASYFMNTDQFSK